MKRLWFIASVFEVVKIIVLVSFMLISSKVSAKPDSTLYDFADLVKDQVSLNQKLDINVNDLAISEIIKSIALTCKLNVSIDPAIKTKATVNFSQIFAYDLLNYLCKLGSLEVEIDNKIIFFKQKKLEVIETSYLDKLKQKITFSKFNQELSFDLKADSLYQVSKIVSQLTGRTILVMPDAKDAMISGFFNNTPLVISLENLANTNNLKLDSTDNGDFIFMKKGELIKDNAPANNAWKKGKKNLNNKIFTLIYTKDSVTTCRLDNVELLQVIDKMQRDSIFNFNVYSEITTKVDLEIDNLTFNQFLRLLLEGTGLTYSKEGNNIFIGLPSNENVKSFKSYHFKYRTLDKVLEAIPKSLKQNVEIVPFPELNTFILSGTGGEVEKLYEFLFDIDLPVPVILIEVLIVDVNNTWEVSTGIEAGISNAPITTQGTLFPAVDLTLSSKSVNDLLNTIEGWGVLNLGRVNSNFYLKLKALEKQGYLNIRSTPKLSTLNGHKANLSIGRKEYYLEVTNNVIGSQIPQNFVTQQYKPVEANLSIDISPVLSDSGQVTLDIKVEQSTFTDRINENGPPGTLSRSFNSSVRMKDTEMIILGGLEEISIEDSGSGVPLLSRIPVLKWFFSSRTRAKSKSKLLLFVQPTVIY